MNGRDWFTDVCKNINGTRHQAMGGAFVARTRMQDVASLTDAGVIVFVTNTQLDAAVQPRFRKAPIVHTKEL